MSPEVLADGLGRNPPLWTDGWRAFSAMDLDVVLRKMEQETPTNIVFLDACRNNSLAVPVSSRRVSRRQCAVASPLAMAAVNEAVPLLTPIETLAVTGFTVPVRLAFCAPAWNENRLVPVGAIAACKDTPLIVPVQKNGPNALDVIVPVKEPGGIVTAKVPIWKVTGWAKGLIPLLVLPKVKLDLRTKASVFGAVPISIIAVGLKAANGTSGIMPISWGMTGLWGDPPAGTWPPPCC